MKKKKNIKLIIGIALDIFIILGYLWIMFCLQTNFLNCDEGGWSKGIKAFKYFTNIGNLLLVVSSVVSIGYILLKKEKDKVFTVLRTCAVTASTIIMVIAYVTLSTKYGMLVCFGFPAYLFEHTILPISGLIQLFILDEKVSLKIKDGLYAMILPGLYAFTWIIVLLILNLPPETESQGGRGTIFLSVHP